MLKDVHVSLLCRVLENRTGNIFSFFYWALLNSLFLFFLKSKIRRIFLQCNLKNMRYFGFSFVSNIQLCSKDNLLVKQYTSSLRTASGAQYGVRGGEDANCKKFSC